MTVKSIWLRTIHKWVGLVIGLQFVLWAISGTAMALLSMDDVAGGAVADTAPAPLPASAPGWAAIRQMLGDQPVSGITVRRLPGMQAIQLSTASGPMLFDSATGRPVTIVAATAANVATAAHPDHLSPTNVSRLTELTLPVRDHALPIWQVDFADDSNSSYYVSGTTGELLERRNDSWRWWDFFWMLHNMDYADRTSFNHPLIITVGFAMAWLAVTGVWLLFRTMWRHDFAWTRRR